MPSDAALYLAENYSNWRTPLTDYDTSVDTPNMIVTDPIFVAWYRFTKLYDYYARGKAPQFRKLWGAMQASLAGDTEVVQRVTKLQEELSDV